MTKTIHFHRENRFVLQQYGAVRKLYLRLFHSIFPDIRCRNLKPRAIIVQFYCLLIGMKRLMSQLNFKEAISRCELARTVHPG